MFRGGSPSGSADTRRVSRGGAEAPPQSAVTCLSAQPAQPAAAWSHLKRLTDVVIALFALVLLTPLLLVVMAAIKLDSPGPVFFRVRRVGYRGLPLLMLKFRKMHHDASGGPLTASQDPRLTRVGRFLTRCRLDELPQLWHVLRGDMSIVGPRPEDPAFVALHAEEYERILLVRPGITGLSQIAYKEECEIVDQGRPIEDYVARIMPQKLIMDTLYAGISGPRVDASILRWTAVTMLLRRPVSVDRRTARMNVRRRPSPQPAREPLPMTSPAAVAPAVALALAGAPAADGSRGADSIN
jgi:lipopolysaccharide/colanic/teichoic acid biosynthesis glycosyltransferase